MGRKDGLGAVDPEVELLSSPPITPVVICLKHEHSSNGVNHMRCLRQLPFVALIAICVILTAAVAAPPTTQSGNHGNSYLFYTKALPVDHAGLAEVPSRFQWSVETGSSGFDIKGNPLPDPRIMLRLYDPDQPYTTALTAQMDLETAAKLHHELGGILVKKLENPNFHHRPQYYNPQKIPTGRFKGIDERGKAIIELEYPTRQPEQVK